jgi:hypothetical protein
MTIKPIFDFNVADWEYHCMYCGAILTSFGVCDGLFLVYKDGIHKIRGRIKFPSGTKVVMEEACANLLSAEDIIKERFHGIPNTSTVEINKIDNPSLRGPDMFEKLATFPLVHIQTKEID